MKKPKYLTAPVPSTRMPGGIPYIIGNELAERFSFYGMRTILFVFMTKYLMDRSGELDLMNDETATGWYHTFTSAVYFTPIVGALVSDVFLGKYRTIMSLSIVYCLGHLALALDETRMGLAVGLTLIAIGAGGIKPCVSAHVGDQFGRSNQHLLEKVFAWFYLSINLGAFVSTVLTPWLLKSLGPHVAFGVPGLLMFLATVVFWVGRRKFVHIPAGGLRFVREAVSPEGLAAIGKLCVLYLFVAVFWSLFDQTGSRWIDQATRILEPGLLQSLGDSEEAAKQAAQRAAQIQAVNPLFILLGVPLFSYVLYPFMGRFFRVTPLRKMGIGFFLAAVSFAIPSWMEMRLQAGELPSVVWQVVAYAFLTAAEILISITGLEFSYTQAPRTMKSLIMSVWLLSVSVGNLFTAGVNFLISRDDSPLQLEGAAYYWFFTGLILCTGVVFVVYASFYRERTYIHDETPGEDEPGSSRIARME